MTLIEIMLAMGILSVAIVTIFGIVAQGHEANMINRNRAIAMDEARGIIAAMRAAKANGAKIPGDIIDLFPQTESESGTVSAKAVSKAASKAKSSVEAIKPTASVLPQEKIIISYGDQKKDPLEINITVNWCDLRGRPASVQLSSAISQY